MADELPPLVAELIGDASELYSTIDDVEARLTAFARQDFTASLGLDIAPLLGKLQEAETALDLFQDERFTADLDLDINEAMTELAAFLRTADSTQITIPVHLDLSPALAELAAFRSAMGGAGGSGAAGAAATAAGTATGSGGGGRSGGGSFLGTAAGTAAGGAAPKGGLLGFGTALLPSIPVAGFGTLGAAAGFGAESIAGLAAGLIGFAAHGVLGGLALGLTSAVTTGVGALTDNAGIGQAVGDLKQYGQLKGNLAQAAAVYGKGSTQYALAQYQYGQWSKTLSPQYVKALGRADTEKTAFGAQFDKDTGPAATTGANILTSVMKTGQLFLPTIGKFAAENMDIIQKSLKPLQTWLAGPGLKAFTQIEQVFSSHLPTAMHAFTQGFELLLKTVAHFAPQTGGLMKFFDNLFTKLNGPGFNKFLSEVQGAIDAFRVWEKFGKSVITMIDELFKHDAKTGQAVIQSLTKLIDKFNKWAKTVAGGDKLHDYMEAHKKEVLELVGLFGNLISIMGQVHLAAGPALMTIVGDLLQFVNLLLQVPGVGKILSYVTAFEILGRHMSILRPFMTTFNGLLRKIALDGLHSIGGAISALGGPFEKLGNWMQGLGNNNPAAQMQATADSLQSTADSMAGIGEVFTTAADAMTTAADQMSAAATTIQTAFAGIGTAAEGAATEVDVATGNMDVAFATTAGDAEVAAAKVDIAEGSEGLAGGVAAGGAEVAAGAGSAGLLARIFGKGGGAAAGEGAGEGIFSGLSFSLMPALLGLGGVQLYNALGEKKLSKLIGTGAASALGDIGTGAAIGGTVGPEGAIAGAIAGLLYAELKPGKPGKTSPLSSAFPHSSPGLGSNAPNQTPAGGVSPTGPTSGYNPKFPHASPGLGTPAFPGTPVPAHLSNAQKNWAKDSTLQRQLAAINVLNGNAQSAKATYGSNSSQYKAALKALQSTQQKYFPTLGKHEDLSKVTSQINKTTAQISVLKTQAHGDQTEVKDQLSSAKKTLSDAKSKMMTLEQGKASKSAIDLAKGAVNTATQHVDNLKGVAADGANASKQIKSDTKNLSKLQDIKQVMSNVNSDTKKLHTDLTPLTGSGITIAKLPPQAMKASGTIRLNIS